MFQIQKLIQADNIKSAVKIELYECMTETALSYRVEESGSAIGCNVCLSGDMTCSISERNQRNHFKNGLSGIWGSPAVVDVEINPGRHCWLSVFIDRSFVEELLASLGVDNSSSQKVKLLYGSEPFAMASPARAATSFIVEQILHCPFEGAMADCYRNCKGMELMLEELDRHFSLRRAPVEACTNRGKVVEAWEMLIANMEEPPTIQQLARTVGVSETTLKRSFRQIYGTSIFAMFQNFRMTEARNMLEKGEGNVTEIAFRIGYTNSGHFSRAFSKHFGFSPKHCQKRSFFTAV